MKFRKRDIEAFDFPGNNIGCLLVHGFTGSPGEMRPLGEYLKSKGFTIKGICLPGHGTKVSDLAEKNWRHWYAEVLEGYNRLEKGCDKVFVVGLSMGGALTLHLAANTTISGGIVPICAPIFFMSKKAYLTPYLQYFVKYVKKNSNNKNNFGSFWYDQYPIKSLASLVTNLKLLKKQLKYIKCPALVIQAKLDKTVEPRSAQLIYDNLGSQNKKIRWLYNSGHIATLDIEREQVFSWIEEFISQNMGEVNQ